jgi:hypothetical protein
MAYVSLSARPLQRFFHPLTPLGGPAPGGMERITPAHALEHVELYLSRQKLMQ